MHAAFKAATAPVASQNSGGSGCIAWSLQMVMGICEEVGSLRPLERVIGICTTSGISS